MKLFTVLFVCIALGAHAQVRIDSYGDTLKGNIKRMIQYSVSSRSSGVVSSEIKPDTTKSIYTCDIAKGTELIKFYNELDKETAREEIQFDRKGHIADDRSYTDLDSLFKKVTYKYDVHGWLMEKFEVLYPFHASYPEDHGEVWTEFKDSLGSRTTYVYDNMGHVTEKTDEEVWDAKTTTVNVTAYKYNAKGNKTEEYDLNLRICNLDRYVFFYVDGKGRGYTKKTLFTYDSLNRVTESTEYTEQKDHPSYMRNERYGYSIGYRRRYYYSGQKDIPESWTFAALYRADDGSVNIGSESNNPDQSPKHHEALEFDRQGNVVKKTQYGTLVFQRTIEYF